MAKSNKETVSTRSTSASSSISKSATRAKKAKLPLPDLSVFSSRAGYWVSLPSDNHKQQCRAAKREEPIPAFKTMSGEKRISARVLANELAEVTRELNESLHPSPR